MLTVLVRIIVIFKTVLMEPVLILFCRCDSDFSILLLIHVSQLSPALQSLGEILQQELPWTKESVSVSSTLPEAELAVLEGLSSFLATDYQQLSARASSSSRRLASAKVDAAPCPSCTSASAERKDALTTLTLPSGDKRFLDGSLELGYGSGFGTMTWSTKLTVPSAAATTDAILSLRQVGHTGVNLALNDFALNAPRLTVKMTNGVDNIVVGPFNLGDITKRSVADTRDPWEWYIKLDPTLVAGFAGQTVTLSMELPGLECPSCSCAPPQDICLLSVHPNPEPTLDLCGIGNILDPDGSDGQAPFEGSPCAESCLGLRVNGVGINKFLRQADEEEEITLEDIECAAISIRVNDRLCVDIAAGYSQGLKCLPVCAVPRNWYFGSLTWPYCSSGTCRPLDNLEDEELCEFIDFVDDLIAGLGNVGDGRRRLRGPNARADAVSNIPAPVWAEAAAHGEARKLISDGHCQRGKQLMQFAVNPTLLVQ